VPKTALAFEAAPQFTSYIELITRTFAHSMLSSARVVMFLFVMANLITMQGLTQYTVSPSTSKIIKEKMMECNSSYHFDMTSFENCGASALEEAADIGLLSVLDKISDPESSDPVALVRGLDFDFVGPTSATHVSTLAHVPEASLAGIAKRLGSHLVGYEVEKGYSHYLFHSIRPVVGGTEGHNGIGELQHHMDMAYLGWQAPRWLLLAGLREGIDPNVTTPIVDNRELLDQIRRQYPEDVAVLRSKSFVLQRPSNAAPEPASPPVALLTGGSYMPTFWLRLDHSSIKPMSPSAARALQHLQDLLPKVERNEVHLRTGDVFILDNYRYLHRRSSFQKCFCGEDRLLMRAYSQWPPVPADRMYRESEAIAENLPGSCDMK